MNSVIRISPPISTLIVNDASDLVLGHVTGGILSTSRLQDEQIITTANSKSSTVRVNFYDKADNRGNYHNVTSSVICLEIHNIVLYKKKIQTYECPKTSKKI